MIRHLSVLTLTNAADVDAIVTALRELPAQVPAIVSYSAGRDAGLAEGNATVGIAATFADADGWAAYQADPNHQRVLAMIRPVLAARAAVQIEE
jgi:S-methylmethionine-dependent homocysteine/selenocysteine methylase